MNRFISSENKFGNYKTIILQDTRTGSKIEIALRGATLLSYFIPVKGELFNIIDGYCTPQELEEQSGARSCIMAPFSNRIEEGFYMFNDEQHQMYNPVDPKRDVIHGFARVINFKVQEILADEEKISVTLFSDYIRRGSFKGYPYCVDITVKFTLSAVRLTVDITGTNVSPETIPFGCGWHPYFRTCNAGINHLILNIPAEKIIEIDENYIPLKGEDAYLPVEELPEADFRSSKIENKNVIGQREVNYCYTDLKADSDKLIRTSITDKKQGLKLNVFQPRGVVYAYTGDGLKKRARTSIAIEPVEFITNAFNRHELKDQLVIKSGNSRTFSFGVEIKYL